MAEYSFERDSRTPFSEAYVIELNGGEAGRVDLHFPASGIVHATLCVVDTIADEEIEALIGEIDERFVLTADPYRDDFVVTVWRGRSGGVFSEELDEDELEGEENGSAPTA